MNGKIKSFIAGSVLGAIVYAIATYTLGFTSAIAIPNSIYTWTKINSVHTPILFVWDLCVVQLLGVGLLAAAVSYLLVRSTSLSWLYVAIGFVLTETCISYSWLFSSSFNQHLPSDSYILYSPHFIVVFLCVFVAAQLGGKHKIF